MINIFSNKFAYVKIIFYLVCSIIKDTNALKSILVLNNINFELCFINFNLYLFMFGICSNLRMRLNGNTRFALNIYLFDLYIF